ncbi:hypothetical protein ISF_09664 [Cordyceps fumosorosea ARSEF 2679]|uniref:NAD dependent epimerase/dehydratase n=1 Tax=Cordyceps fumosorosea (strain ARSEF 2679) TaxID=1081104 RepID=A0A167EAF1_CORFA|nr:hypothetical protein ISF_09664 [Cordyceps fumosorosea ARSEF 2679]OAA43579.1 hypothetical protein ISF_09664 [Cordyceps fumosorosea ARSEF 2679]
MLPKRYPIDGTEGYPRTTPMKLIVCGFPRTGTMSTHAALQMLGFNRTHHMIHVVTEPEGAEMPEWTRALRAKYRGEGTFTKLDWDRLLGDCQGCIDYPSALFAADLVRLYPEAKVVMLNRDPDAWYESVSATVAAIRDPPSLLRRAKRLYCWLLCARLRGQAAFWQEVHFAEGGYDHFTEKDKAIGFMRASYDECRAAVAADRRIEWKVQDGWEPLCKHLGVEVPKVRDAKTGELVTAPFPRINDRAAFQQNVEIGVARMMAEANEVLFGLLGRGLAMAGLGYGAYMAWKFVAARP